MIAEKINPLLLTDSYKVAHYRQYPPHTESVYSYFESRGGDFDWTILFGLQYIAKAYLTGEFCRLEHVHQAKEFCRRHFGRDLFNEAGWIELIERHQGRLPVRIRAVPEGLRVPTGNVLMTIENTDPKFYWLTNWLETLLTQVWYPSTVTTQSVHMRQTLLAFLHQSGTPADVDFKLHDFGFRGTSCVDQAAIGGGAHLAAGFQGSDTLPGIWFAQQFYGAEMPGHSIPASEHSTITAWGRDHELDAMANMLRIYPTGTFACVSDSFDVFRACRTYWGEKLKREVIQRDGVLVVRPDSGDPPTIVVQVLSILGEAFGYSHNSKGYKVLHPKVRVIQGDAIDRHSLVKILQALHVHGFSADNVAFGSGGGLLQKLDRDTSKYAFKCSSVTIDGRRQDVWKDPITDAGKRSKRGRLKLCLIHDTYHTVPEDFGNEPDVLELVFENGHLMRAQTLNQVRSLATSDDEEPTNR